MKDSCFYVIVCMVLSIVDGAIEKIRRVVFEKGIGKEKNEGSWVGKVAKRKKKCLVYIEYGTRCE